MAKVKISFMGDFADIGCPNMELDAKDFYDLVIKVAEACPDLRKFLLDGTELKTDYLAFCHGKVISDPTTTFKDGDVVTFYPPVTL
ncbi:MoaD/ThiS family protein [Coprothermobacter platensis]|jgi:molybdopterin converting factor small subunit|uniref:MoaD/ThiS family protein n=1 Tax=Coprothermobacter platensis TaxID=108819 RepID=UPI00036CEEC9|nr:MoaD/ThiS family protein [Coprothermobacter platensis]